MIDYYVRTVALPITVEGVSVPNDDGTFDIYINSRLTREKQEEVLAHELRHLEAEHFYVDIPLRVAEQQADTGKMYEEVFHPPAGTIPHFYSLDSFGHWIQTICAQKHVDLAKAKITRQLLIDN